MNHHSLAILAKLPDVPPMRWAVVDGFTCQYSRRSFVDRDEALRLADRLEVNRFGARRYIVLPAPAEQA